MGYGLKRKFEIIDWYTDLAGDASRILRDLMDGFDDDTWDAWDYKRNRQNYIGAHVWVSKSKIASRIRKGRSSVSRSFKEMENKGWITQAHNVKALDNNRTYIANAPTISGEPPKHYVFNISKMCRVLNVVATVELFGLKFDSDDAGVLLECARTDYPDDYENPTYRSVEDFEDLVILNYEDLIKYGPPDRWEDLQLAKKESAGEGASAKVGTGTEGVSIPPEELSSIDVITSDDEFAKIADDLFPYTVSISQEDGDFPIDFLSEHINEQGQLDIDLVGVTDEIKEEFYDLSVGAVGRVRNFNNANSEVLLAMRRYLDKQRE